MSALPLFSMDDLRRRGFAPFRSFVETLDIVPREPGVSAALWAGNGLPMFLESNAWWTYDVCDLESQ